MYLPVFLMLFVYPINDLPLSFNITRNDENIVTIENVYKIGGKEIDQQSKNYIGSRDTNN